MDGEISSAPLPKAAEVEEDEGWDSLKTPLMDWARSCPFRVPPLTYTHLCSIGQSSLLLRHVIVTLPCGICTSTPTVPSRPQPRIPQSISHILEHPRHLRPRNPSRRRGR